MKKLGIFLGLIVLAGFLAGCSIPAEKSHAENVAVSFFESVKEKDFEKAMTFVSSKFFERSSRDEYLQLLKGTNAKLGDLQEYKLVSWNFRKYVGGAGSGTYWELRYEVRYAKYSAVETLTLFKPAVGGEVGIVGHNLSSSGFVQE